MAQRRSIRSLVKAANPLPSSPRKTLADRMTPMVGPDRCRAWPIRSAKVHMAPDPRENSAQTTRSGRPREKVSPRGVLASVEPCVKRNPHSRGMQITSSMAMPGKMPRTPK